MDNMEERLKDYEEKLERAMRNHASIEAEYMEVKRRYQNSKFNIKQLENNIEICRNWLGFKNDVSTINNAVANIDWKPRKNRISEVPIKDLRSKGEIL